MTLMTLHAAMDLSSRCLYHRDGGKCLSHAAEDPDELEAGTRLAYVGTTRAEKILYLTNANSRFCFWRTQLQSSDSVLSRN